MAAVASAALSLHNLAMTWLARVVTSALLFTSTLLPGVIWAAAPQPPPAAGAAEPGAPVRLDRFVDRVWKVEDSTAAAGTLYVFLSDNTLVVSARTGAPAVGTWAEDVSGLVLTERGRTTRVDVLESTTTRFRLRLHGKTGPTDLTMVPAVAAPAPVEAAPVSAAATPAAPAQPAPPLGSPYRCGGDAFRVAFDGDTAYLTWPDNTVVVLREIKTAEARPSRRTYTDGQLKVVEDTSEAFTRVLFARPGFRPRPCTATR